MGRLFPLLLLLAVAVALILMSGGAQQAPAVAPPGPTAVDPAAETDAGPAGAAVHPPVAEQEPPVPAAEAAPEPWRRRETGPEPPAAAAPPPAAERPTARLRLRAVRPSGLVWPDLPVELRWRDGGERHHLARTDLFGTIERELPADLEWLQLSWGDGNASARESRWYRTALQPWSTTVLFLAPKPPAAFRGRLLDAGERPVAEAMVRLDPGHAGNALLALTTDPAEDLARTDAAGAFSLGTLAGTAYLRFHLPSGAEATTFLPLAPGRPLDFEFRLPPARPLEVRVLGPDRRPLGGARLAVGSRTHSFEAGRLYFDQAWSRSEADGWARFGEVPAEEQPLSAALDGYLDWRGVLEADTEQAEIVLEPSWTLAGTVLRADGRPAGQAIVLCWIEEDPGRSSLLQPSSGSWQVRRAGPDGAFRFRNRVRGARAALLAVAPGQARTLLWPVDLGPLSGGLGLVLGPASPLAGRVLQADGRPCQGAEIQARRVDPDATWAERLGDAVPVWSEGGYDAGPWRPLDEVGGFAFANLPAGLYDLTVRHRSDRRVLARARLGSLQEDVVIRVGEGRAELLELDLAVRDGATGPPVVDFELVLTTGEGGRRRLSLQVLSSDGRFLWDGLPAGGASIEVRAAGFLDWRSGWRRFGAGRRQVAVELERG